MIKRLDEDTSLRFKSLSAEEKSKKGILGRLYGPVAGFASPTRNGRKYSQELWEKLFNSDLIRERFANGGVFGQLCHPDYEEVDFEKVAVCMPEPPVKDNKGQLIGYVDILDTPCGRIAYQLAKYGYKFGISSRGTGDIIEGANGDEVDPDTYQLNAFDLVEIPAMENARLAFVESLNTKKYGKTLRERLTEELNKASSDDRVIMSEALDDLGLNLEEDVDGNLTLDDIDEDKYPYLYEAMENDFVSLVIQDGTMLNDEFNETAMEEEGIDTMAVKDDIERLAEHKGVDFQFDIKHSESLGEAANGSVTYYLNKMKSGDPEKVYMNAKGNPNAEKAYKQLKGMKEELEVNSKDYKDQKHYDDSIYDIDTAVNNLLLEIEEDPNFGTESETYKTLQQLSIILGKNAKLIDEKLDWYNEDYDDSLDKISLKWAMKYGNLGTDESLEESFDPRGYSNAIKAINDGIETDEDEEALSNYLNNIIGYCKTIADDYDLYIPALDNVNESHRGSDINKEVVNDKSEEPAIIAELQESLEKVKRLKADNLSLQEKLSVGNAKVAELKEQLTKYKRATTRLSEETVKIKEYKNTLRENEKTIANNKQVIEKLSKSELDAKMKLSDTESDLNKYKADNKKLTEDINKVNSKLTKTNDLLGKYKKSYTALKESYLNLKVDNYGLKKDEVKQKLGESYKIKDIDSVCEELSRVKTNISKLPFRITEDTKIGVKGAKESRKSMSDDDYISDSLRRMIN